MLSSLFWGRNPALRPARGISAFYYTPPQITVEISARMLCINVYACVDQDKMMPFPRVWRPTLCHSYSAIVWEKFLKQGRRTQLLWAKVLRNIALTPFNPVRITWKQCGKWIGAGLEQSFARVRAVSLQELSLTPFLKCSLSNLLWGHELSYFWAKYYCLCETTWQSHHSLKARNTCQKTMTPSKSFHMQY